MESVEVHSSQPSVIGATPSSKRGEDEKGNLLWKEERRALRRRLKQERMNEKQRRFGLILCLTSFTDVLLSSIVVFVAFAHGYLDNGVSLYCLGLQAMSHLLSSLLLGSRFWGEYHAPEDAPAGPENGLLREKRRVYLSREKSISLLMGFVMLVSTIALLTKAIRKMMYWDQWYEDHMKMDQDAMFATIFLTWYGVAIYSSQAVVRGFVATIMNRSVVWVGLTCSLVTLLYLLVIGIAARAQDEWSWKAEPIAAAVLACVNVGEGIRLVSAHRHNIDAKLDIDPWA